MKLVIVESPTKAKTIGKILGNGFVIKSSTGHIMDLPKSKLGVDVEHNFTPLFEVTPDKKKIIAELKKLAKESDEIVLATDPDREGEAISAHIQDLLTKATKNDKKKFVRVVFHEITKEAIEAAFQHPGVVNHALVDAQTARRVLDRLVGYKLSPILWQKIRRGLSAGRVQSVALRLIVEREREIEKFTKEPYFTVTASFASTKDKTKSAVFELIEIDNKRIEEQLSFSLYDGKYTTTKTSITAKEQAESTLKDIEAKKYIVSDVLEKQTKRSPQPPFTTSSLQQEAARRFGYSGKRTMSLAQKLYEEGYISYHRTDSVQLAESAVVAMRAYIGDAFGEKYVSSKPRVYITKQKLAQEAHEAIRPTNVRKKKEDVEKDLGGDFAKLYELIWIRAIASQMADAIVESTTVFVRTLEQEKAPSYLFKTNGSVLVFEGFLKVNPFGLQDKKLPKFESLESVDLLSASTEDHETTPPPRYNDASLVSSLEDAGIGRPSTYASIISTIESRNYIEKQNGKFIPTQVGFTVTDFLVKNFSTVDDIPFTAQMEDDLDEIAKGEKQWVPVVKDFYLPFSGKLKEVEKVDRVKIFTEATGELCPKDGAPLVIRTGRFGKFISCQNFPACDYKKTLVQETNFICPKDGGKIIAKKTKKGRTFYGCSSYPNCKFAVWKLADLQKDQSPQEQV